MGDRKANIPGGVIVFHSQGFKDILNSDQLRGVVEDVAQRMCVEAMTVGGAAPTKQYSYQLGETDRVRAIVHTASGHATRSNQKHNTLVKVRRQVKV